MNRLVGDMTVSERSISGHQTAKALFRVHTGWVPRPVVSAAAATPATPAAAAIITGPTTARSQLIPSSPAAAVQLSCRCGSDLVR